MASMAELRAQAKELGIKLKAGMSKVDLESVIMKELGGVTLKDLEDAAEKQKLADKAYNEELVEIEIPPPFHGQFVMYNGKQKKPGIHFVTRAQADEIMHHLSKQESIERTYQTGKAEDVWFERQAKVREIH